MDSVETPAPEKTAYSQTEEASFPSQETPEELSRFVGRHIGPNDEEIDAMLAEVGFQNLDDFIDATVPKDIRLTNPLDLPAGKSEQEALTELRTIRAAKQSRAQLHRCRLFRLRRAARDPAQRAREPRLVHRLHALSGRDRAGPSRGAAQFPDHDHRPDRARHRERVAPRRSDRRSRSDGAVPRRRKRT